MADYDEVARARDRKEAAERGYRKMMALKEEVDAQLGSVSLTEALYADREDAVRSRLGKADALAKS